MKNLGDNTGKIAFLILKIFAWGLLAVLALMLFAFFSIVFFGKKDSAKSKTASVLAKFGLQKMPNNREFFTETQPKAPLYKMLEDYTFYSRDESKTIITLKKDRIFYGGVKQHDASFGSNPDLNMTYPAVMQDFVSVNGVAHIEVAVPPAKCVKLTDAEVVEYKKTHPDPVY